MNLADLIRPLAIRISNMIAQASVRSIDDAKTIQLSRCDLLEGESREIYRPQNYGFTSVPLEGAEAVVIFVDGRRDNGLAICVDDRRYRLQNLQGGEVAVYDSTGSKIVLKSDGSIQLTPSGGDVEITGNLNVSGTVAATTDVVSGSISLKTHAHSVSGGNAGGPVAFVPPALTGGPV